MDTEATGLPYCVRVAETRSHTGGRTMWKAVTLMLAGAVGAAFAIHAVFAQGGPMPQNPPMHHIAGMQATSPAMPGQDAFGALAEVVRLLDADPRTDWSRVDLERLR